MWYVQWAQSPVVEGESCRGCKMDFAGKRYGEESNLARIRLMCNSVRETEAGVYCAECFSRLPGCPICGINPTSHSEYPCIRCEVLWMNAAQAASGGREASPTYRGWSTAYSGKGQDNGRKAGGGRRDRRKYSKI